MNRNEYHELANQAHSGNAAVAIRLMGDCGLRGGEIVQFDVDYLHLADDDPYLSVLATIQATEQASDHFDRISAASLYLPPSPCSASK